MIQTREERLSTLKIGPDDLVVEIGSGNLPFIRSDILVDSDPGEDAERSGALVTDRPLVIADGHQLPFRDKSVDYFFCSQVLEHATDPARFLDELVRAGRRGYLETPNEFRERLIRQPFHRWVVSLDDDTLVLRENRLPAVFGSIFRNLMGNPLYGHFYRHHYSGFNIMLEWDGEIRYRFEAPAAHLPDNPDGWIESLATELPGRGPVSTPPLSREPGIRTSLKWLIRAVSRQVGKRIKRRPRRSRAVSAEALFSMLCCPVCRSDLALSSRRDTLTCVPCARDFPVVGTTPILLADPHEVERLQKFWRH